MIRKDIFGYYDSPLDGIATHDPGLETNCPICGNQLEMPVTTVSLMKEGDNKSYFYRTHKNCYHSLPEAEINKIESSLIDNL